MAEVITSINCHLGDSKCVAERLALAKDFSPWVHLDVADGQFTFHKSWNAPEEWSSFTSLPTEVHLMVEDPLAAISSWSEVQNVKRFIVHVETLTPGLFHTLQEKAHAAGKSVMLAMNPETSAETALPYLEHVLQFQVLAVHPGLAGQKFLPLVLDKISWLRGHIPNAIIEVDGGINLETARMARAAGADILVSDHFIFSSSDPKKAYEDLLEL